jgi:hypothetical protein
MVNGLALLGWNPPHRSDEITEKAGNVFSKHEVLTMKDLLNMVRIAYYSFVKFDLEKVGKSGVKFS